MIDLMTLIYQHGKQPVLKSKVEETVAWVLREMRIENAAFASSLDADSEGEEGKFYIWTESEVDSVLAGTPVDRFKQAFGISRDGNFHHEGKPTGRNILHRIANLPAWTEAEEITFTTQKQRLLEAREKRVRPGRDDKVLVDWNGLMVTALVNAAMAFDRRDWIEAAQRAFQFICDKLSEGDRLFHSYRAGKAAASRVRRRLCRPWPRCGLALWEATQETAAISIAPSAGPARWIRTSGTSCKAATFIPATLTFPSRCARAMPFDTQTPSGNGMMIGVHGRCSTPL
jgi:uncharacterized protein YyaL (SSP411 family)